MAFQQIAARVQYPRTLSQRYRTQDQLLRFLDGTLYDDAKLAPFDHEYTDPRTNYGEKIKLRDRRPSVVSNFAGQFVDQTIGLLWMDEQFPVVRVFDAKAPAEQDGDAEKDLQHLIEMCELDEVMARATYLGSVGSVAIVVRGLDSGMPWIEVWKGYQCVPVFDAQDPTKLKALVTMYPLTGEECKLAGSDIDKEDLTKEFWLRIDLDNKKETRYKPMLKDRFERIGEKDDKTGQIIKWEPLEEYTHRFGRVPAVWGKAPNSDARNIDGPCIFGKAVDTIVEIDYQLSQIGRAYKYTMDPLIAVTRGELNMTQYSPSGNKPLTTTKDQGGNIERDAKNTVDVEPGGSADLLELTGTGLTACLEYVTKLREFALESIGGMKSDSETQKGAQSGKALELLYQALVIVIKRLRLAWGNRVLIPLIELLLVGIQTGELTVSGVNGIEPDSVTLRLNWPQWMTPTGADFLATVQGWQILAGSSPQDPSPIVDRETVTEIAATNLGFQDAEALKKKVAAQVTTDQQTDLDTQEATLKMQAEHAPKPANGSPGGK